MLQNRLIIAKKSKRNEIYEKSKNKWIIDFEDKIKSWSENERKKKRRNGIYS